MSPSGGKGERLQTASVGHLAPHSEHCDGAEQLPAVGHRDLLWVRTEQSESVGERKILWRYQADAEQAEGLGEQDLS